MKQTSAQNVFEDISKANKGHRTVWYFLVNALESIGNIEAVLKAPITHGNALLAILSYQSIGNCMAALPYHFTTSQFPHLGKSVFVDVSGGGARPWFDRMVSAHQTDFHHFLLETLGLLNKPTVRQGILDDVIALREVIEKTFVSKFSIAVIKQLPELRKVALPADTVRFALSTSHGVCADPLTNIRTIFKLSEGMYRGPDEFIGSTIQSRVAALMLAQFLGNNVNLLESNGVTLSCTRDASANRNKIAHAPSLSALIDVNSTNISVQRSIWYDYLRACFITLKDEIQQRFPMVPAEEPGLGLEPKASLDTDSKESKESKLHEPAARAFVAVDRFQNQLQLLEKLVKNEDIKGFDVEEFRKRETSLSDYNIVELLSHSINSNNLVLFSEILDNLPLYTTTPVKKLVNLPLVLEQDSEKSREISPTSPSLPPRIYSAVYKIQNGLKHKDGEIIFLLKLDRKSPIIIDHYLITDACISHQNSVNFTKKLIRCGANPNVETLYNVGTFEPLITAAILGGQYKEARMMVEHGAYLNLRDAYGYPVIYAVAQKGTADMLRFVLDNNADLTSEYRVASKIPVIVVNRTPRGMLEPQPQNYGSYICNSFLGFIIGQLIEDSKSHEACRLLVNAEVRKKGFDLGIQIITGKARLETTKGSQVFTALEAAQHCKMEKTIALVVYLNALLAHANDKRFELFKVCLSNSREMIADFLTTQSITELIQLFNAKLPLQLGKLTDHGLCYFAWASKSPELYDMASTQDETDALKYCDNLKQKPKELDRVRSRLSSSPTLSQLKLMDFVKFVADDEVVQYLHDFKDRLNERIRFANLTNSLDKTFVSCGAKFERASVSSAKYTPDKSNTPAVLVAAYLSRDDLQATFANKVKPTADTAKSAPSAVAKLEKERKGKSKSDTGQSV